MRTCRKCQTVYRKYHQENRFFCPTCYEHMITKRLKRQDSNRKRMERYENRIIIDELINIWKQPKERGD